MNFEFEEGDFVVTARFGERSVLADWREIDAFRLRIGDADNPVTSLLRFVTRATLADEIPATFLIYRAGRLHAVVLLRFRRKLGIPSGLVSAGDGVGEGSVIASPTDRVSVLEAASRVLIKIPFIHTVILTMLWPDPVYTCNDRSVARSGGSWHFRQVGFRLELSDGQKATMERLGYKMRRNLGYYRRRAEAQLGCRPLLELRPEQRLQAVEALAGQGTYRMNLRNARKLDAMLLAMPGQFAMGLQDARGNWLSYIAGWRTREGTYIDWQLNREQPASASISTVIRSYLLEQEFERRSLAIVFVGGTAPNWSRACVPVVCADLFVVRKGVLGSVSRHLARRFNPSGQLARLQGRAAP